MNNNTDIRIWLWAIMTVMVIHSIRDYYQAKHINRMFSLASVGLDLKDMRDIRRSMRARCELNEVRTAMETGVWKPTECKGEEQDKLEQSSLNKRVKRELNRD